MFHWHMFNRFSDPTKQEICTQFVVTGKSGISVAVGVTFSLNSPYLNSVFARKKYMLGIVHERDFGLVKVVICGKYKNLNKIIKI